MNRQNPLVSVIMACHNSSVYLDEAISSVLGQTLGDLELILIDDCSSDDTLEIAKRYEVDDSRVSVLSLPVNSGPALARDAGIRVARGEWLGILDSDDVAMPSRFEEQMRLANSDRDFLLIGSNSVSMDSEGHTIKEHKYPTSHRRLVKRLEYMRAFPPHSSFVYRKDAVLKLTAFNPKFTRSQDYDLWLRLSEYGKIASVDRALVKIRRHGYNISNLGGGDVQVLFAHAAAACHFLRIHGYPDPSVSDEEAIWSRFLQLTEKHINGACVFERKRVWSEARADYFGSSSQLIGIKRFGERVFRSGYAIPLLKHKFIGSRLAEQIARDWIKTAN